MLNESKVLTPCLIKSKTISSNYLIIVNFLGFLCRHKIQRIWSEFVFCPFRNQRICALSGLLSWSHLQSYVFPQAKIACENISVKMKQNLNMHWLVHKHLSKWTFKLRLTAWEACLWNLTGNTTWTHKHEHRLNHNNSCSHVFVVHVYLADTSDVSLCFCLNCNKSVDLVTLFMFDTASKRACQAKL